jgi:hypothetical protein
MLRFLVVCLTVALLGCDTVHGVQRVATLEAFPSIDCVRTVLDSTPGITKIDYGETDGGAAITLSGLKPEGPTHTFSYAGSESSHIKGHLQIRQDHRGIVSFDQTLLWLNGTPPQEDIDATRPVMRSIEQRLARDCGIHELPSRIMESCSGVRCGSSP